MELEGHTGRSLVCKAQSLHFCVHGAEAELRVIGFGVEAKGICDISDGGFTPDQLVYVDETAHDRTDFSRGYGWSLKPTKSSGTKS
jgi:hypothetical protein